MWTVFYLLTLALFGDQDVENAMTVGEWLCQSDAPRCDALLACGALIVAELRAAVLAETQFTCSAGIGHNKVWQKLVPVKVSEIGTCNSLIY